MKARPQPLGLLGEVALLHQHPNSTCRLNTQICVYTDSFVIYLSWNNQLQNYLSLLFYMNIFQSVGSHQIITQVFIQTFGGFFFVQSVCFLYGCYPIEKYNNILLRSSYSSCSNTHSFPLWNPEFQFFFQFAACNLQPPGEYNWPLDQSLTKLLILQKRRPTI